MKKMMAVVQEGMYSNDQIKIMEKGLKDIYKENYSDESVLFLWLVQPKGYAYSERKLSEATIVMIEVENDTAQNKREELMKLSSNFLLENFSISPLDSVITVSNSSFVNGFFDAQRKRIAPLKRPLVLSKIVLKTFLSKISNGYLQYPVSI